MRLAVFVAAGAIAGIAGALSVNQQGYVSPNLLHWTQSGTLMVMVILGGVAPRSGAACSAPVLVLLQESLSAYTAHWEFWTGWVLLAVVLFARRGLAGWLARARRRAMSDAGVLLEAQQLSKRFGGVVASAGIDLQVRAGEIHALIGPNGAGKTTLVAQLAGQLAPDRGRIVFAGEDITRLSPHERARRGLARSFQITRLFRSFDVRENVVLALQAAGGAQDDRREMRDAPTRCSPRSASPTRRRRPSTPSPTASSAPSRWAWRWRAGRACCCSTSRWPAWATTNRSAWKR
jgi:branched-chain amino acid transport system permease protein